MTKARNTSTNPQDVRSTSTQTPLFSLFLKQSSPQNRCMHAEAHGILDGVQEVHGMIFDALSLVVGPEVPGVPGTQIEIMETARREQHACMQSSGGGYAEGLTPKKKK